MTDSDDQHCFLLIDSAILLCSFLCLKLCVKFIVKKLQVKFVLIIAKDFAIISTYSTGYEFSYKTSFGLVGFQFWGY